MSDASRSWRASATALAVGRDQVMTLLTEPVTAATQPTAVLICPPFGWAEMCSYRARRTWAAMLASAGYPVARFDLPSSGDSAGTPHDPGRLESWTAAVGGVAEWLRRRGAERIVAIGLELGGVLACKSAADGAPIDDFILWAVPARGGRLLREMRASAKLISASYPEDERPTDADHDLELTGYVLDADTATALETLRLTSLQMPDPASRRVLLLGRNGLGVDERLREYFVAAGSAVTVADGDDYADMLIHPQQARAPRATIARTISWLGEQAVHRGVAPGATAQNPLERDAIGISWNGTLVHETPLTLPVATGDLFGVLSEPAGTRSDEWCLVLLNGGMIRHTGPNRAWVEIARRWAARGLPVVRVDLEGIGDSDGDLPRPLPDGSLYTERQIDQTCAILDHLAGRGLPDRFVLVGLCSGAYWGLHAALRDPRVAAVLAVNLYCFFWDQRLVVERDRHASTAALRRGVVTRLRHGGLTAELARRGLRSFLPRRSDLGLGKSVEQRHTPMIQQALDRLEAQDTQLLLMFGDSEPLYGQLKRQRLLESVSNRPNVTLEGIPSRDHMFRALWLQRHVHEVLDSFLERLTADERSEGRHAAR